MSKLRQADRGYWIVLAICFLAIWPFLKNGSLPHDTDAELHIFRLAELHRMWEGGAYYPRWAANFYYGFGYPIFNYYAPLTYYIGLVFMLLPGVGAVAAIKLVFIVGIVGAGISMYSFVRDGWGKSAGFVAAASYIYAPYILYVDPHARGVVPETFSFATFPLALVLLNRLRQRPSAANFAFASAAIASIILVHNLMAMVFGGLLFGWFVWQLAVVRAQPNRFALFGMLAFIVGVAASAFFWLPMVLEQSAIQINSVVGEGNHYDYRNHFLTLAELFAPSLRLDWGATEPHYRLNLGVLQWLLALLGSLALLRPATKQRRALLFFFVAAGILIMLMLPASGAIWRVVPVLPFLQFPWRLLGATNAMLAVLGGVGVASAYELLRARLDGSAQRAASLLPAACVVAIVALALPLTQVAPWESFGGTSVADVARSELLGRWRGTTSTADFVPKTVVLEPRAEEVVMAALINNQPNDRLNRAVLGDAQVESDIVTPLRMRFAVDTPHFYIMRLYIFDFPGWRATLDGVPLEIKRSEPEGFIILEIPEGQHEVELWFGTTQARRGGWLLSALGLLGMVGVGAFLARQPRPVRQSHNGIMNGHERLVLAFVLGLIGLHLAVLEPLGLLYLNSAENEALPAATQTNVNYSDQLTLLGFTAPDTVRPGQKIRVDLYWTAQPNIDKNWQVFVHLLSPETTVLTQSDKLNPGDFPTKQWPIDKYVRDPHWLIIPEDIPAGDYRLTAGLWSIETGQRVPVVDPPGEWYVLRSVTVKK